MFPVNGVGDRTCLTCCTSRHCTQPLATSLRACIALCRFNLSSHQNRHRDVDATRAATLLLLLLLVYLE